MSYLPLIALILNFLGTLSVAFSIGRNQGNVVIGGQEAAAVVRPWALQAGLAAIAIGFAIQLGLEIYKLLSST